MQQRVYCAVAMAIAATAALGLRLPLSVEVVAMAFAVLFLGVPHGALDVQGRHHLAVEHQLAEAREELLQGLLDRVAEGVALVIPGPLRQLVGGVHHEA